MTSKKFIFVLFLFFPLISNSDENLGKSKIFVEKLGQQVVEKVSNTEISEQERYNKACQQPLNEWFHGLEPPSIDSFGNEFSHWSFSTNNRHEWVISARKQ